MKTKTDREMAIATSILLRKMAKRSITIPKLHGKTVKLRAAREGDFHWLYATDEDGNVYLLAESCFRGGKI